MTAIQFKTALVTGGAGFIGSHLAKKLIEDGLHVIVLDNLSVGKKENLPKNAELIVGDIMDEELVSSIFSRGIDVVFHEAAIVTIRESVKNFYGDAMTNIMGTLNILRASLEFGVKKMVFASSMAVYSDKSNHTPVSENDDQTPIAPYGLSKLTSENYLSHFADSNALDIVCLRYFNTYGENQTFTPYVGVITIFVNRLLKGEPPVIFGDGKQVRDFVYVEDIVQANIKAMYSNVHFGIFNVGTGIGTPVNEIANILSEKINPQIEPEYSGVAEGELRYSIADIDRIKDALGFQPECGLENYIDRVIEQYNS
jgi:UDP-glucose 4-epimerase